MTDTIKQIIEDTLLTAANIMAGMYGEDCDDKDLPKYTAGVVLNIAERLVVVTGIDERHVWTPEALEEMLAAEWGTEYERREA